MQGEAWRTKKQVREHRHYRHHRMSAKEKRAFRERMEESKGIKRRERWNAYGSHRNIDTRNTKAGVPTKGTAERTRMKGRSTYTATAQRSESSGSLSASTERRKARNTTAQP